MAGKSLRLSQLAKECNTGVNTLIEFLEEKGLDEKLRPNTKIEPDFIQLAYEKFAPDMARKEESEKVSQQKKEEKELLRAEAEDKREAPEVIKAKSSVTGPKMVGKIDLDKPAETPSEEAETQVAEEVEEPVAEPETKEEPTAAEEPETKEEESPKEAEEPVAEVEEVEAEAGRS